MSFWIHEKIKYSFLDLVKINQQFFSPKRYKSRIPVQKGPILTYKKRSFHPFYTQRLFTELRYAVSNSLHISKPLLHLKRPLGYLFQDKRNVPILICSCSQNFLPVIPFCSMCMKYFLLDIYMPQTIIYLFITQKNISWISIIHVFILKQELIYKMYLSFEEVIGHDYTLPHHDTC